RFHLPSLPPPLRQASLITFTLPVCSLALSVRDKTALLARSTVGSFFLLPELSYAAGTVAPQDYHPARAAARVPLAARHGGAQNGNKRATTRGGPAGVGRAEPSPTCGVRERPLHVGRSDSL